MKIRVKLITRNSKGRKREVEAEGEVLQGVAGRTQLDVLRALVQAEQVLNTHTTIRVHIETLEG